MRALLLLLLSAACSPPELLSHHRAAVSALIGPDGGSLAITDPGSALFGTRLEVPPRALEESIWLSIGVATDPPSELAAVGPVLEIAPHDVWFAEPALLWWVMPDATTSELRVFHSDPELDKPGWVALATVDGGTTADSPFLVHGTGWFEARPRPQDITTHTSTNFSVDFVPDPASPPYQPRDASKTIADEALEFLEEARAIYAGLGYIEAWPATTRVFLGNVDTTCGLLTAGCAQMENASYSLYLSQPNNARHEVLRNTVLHELFHIVQYRSLHPTSPSTQRMLYRRIKDRNARFLLEMTALAMENRHGTPAHIVSSMIDEKLLWDADLAKLPVRLDSGGYRGFAAMEFLNGRYGLDLEWFMWSPAMHEMRDLTELGLDYFYRRVGELVVESPYLTWAWFTVAYRHEQIPALVRGIDQWPPPPLQTQRVYGAMDFFPGTLVPWESSPYLVMDSFSTSRTYKMVTNSGRYTGGGTTGSFELAPVCHNLTTSCADSIARLPDDATFVLRPRINGGPSRPTVAVMFRVPYSGTQGPGGMPEMLGILQRDQELEVPVEELRAHPYDRYIAVFVASRAVWEIETAIVETFFRSRSRILFVRQNHQTARQEIWSVNPDGRSLVQITSEDHLPFDPSWAPDGKRFAYLARNPSSQRLEMRVRDAGGAGEQIVVPATADSLVGRAAWLDNNRFVKRRPGSLDADTVFDINLGPQTTLPGVSCSQETSPARTWLACIRTENNVNRLYRKDIATGALTQLTSDSAQAHPIVRSGISISPDGSKIAFRRMPGPGSAEVWVIGSDGTDEHAAATTGFNDAPSWTRQGLLVFSWQNPATGVVELHRVDANGGGRVAITIPPTGHGDYNADGW